MSLFESFFGSWYCLSLKTDVTVTFIAPQESHKTHVATHPTMSQSGSFAEIQGGYPPLCAMYGSTCLLGEFCQQSEYEMSPKPKTIIAEDSVDCRALV